LRGPGIPSRTGVAGGGCPFGEGGAGAVANRLKRGRLRPFRPPRSLEKGAGCKARYGFGGEGEDLEARASPFTAPMKARRGRGQPSRG
jgi:hypothetical protein